MKIEYIPENDKEKQMLELMESDDLTVYTEIERIEFLEEFAKAHAAVSALHNREIRKLKDGSVSADDVQKVIDELKAVRNEMEVFRQFALELEEYKVRLRNTESDLRQALEKISRLEQSDKVTGKVLNVQADQLDRLNKEVFDEDSPKHEGED